MKNKKILSIYFPLMVIKLPKLKLSFDKNLILNIFFLGLLPAVFFYIFQTTKLIYLNYNLSELETKIKNLTVENNSFEKTKLQKYSLSDIENSIANLDFKEINEIKYINVSEKYLAQLKK